MHKAAPQSATGTVDNHIIAAMRLVLAASGLLIIYIDPAEPSRFVAVTHLLLACYTAYSALLYTLALHASSYLLETIYRWVHWVDVAWYVLLISLSNGTSSIFFFGFFFAILVASFRWGFISGLRVTLLSVILFTSVGLLTAPRSTHFELNRALVRPIYLLVLGYMMAYWGGHELNLKRRLALLKEVTTLSNPRFGVDRTIGTLLERLRAFYDGDVALAVTHDAGRNEYHLRRVDRRDPEAGMKPSPLPAHLAQQLLAVPANQAVIYNQRGRWLGLGPRYLTIHMLTGTRSTEGETRAAALAATLDAKALITVPLQYQHEAVGRLYVTTSSQRFDESDVDLLLQVFEHVRPVIDNIRLVDRLASHAAEEERQRIARDLHDSVIQPYIGLQMGLAAVRRKAVAGGADVAAELERLYELANDGIADLRGYVHGLRHGSDNDDNLQASLRRFAEKFAAVTGITVEVEAAADIPCNDRLGTEVFQMVAEGLSNIRRHTEAEHATIGLMRQNGHLVLRVENEREPGTPPPSFTPRSISERAAALGGYARVEQAANARTAVIVTIPL